MKKSFKLTALTILAALCLAIMIPATNLILSADTVENEYYVCLSTENYRIKKANQMSKTGDDYFLENVALTNATKFYVSDLNGTRYYAKNGDEFQVEETGEHRYILKFNPSQIFDTKNDGYKKTDAHITYKFYAPETVTIKIDGEDKNMTYNNYQTAYDLYYISSIHLTKDQIVAYDTEEHKIEQEGNYRILFTPTKSIGVNQFAFNQDGAYGTGDGYVYQLYLEFAPEYFVTTVNEELMLETSTVDINNEKAFALTRYEDNVAAPEYRGAEFFTPTPDYNFKYRIYDKLSNVDYQMIDDDNDADTTFSKITVNHVGWNNVAFVDTENQYSTTLVEKTYDFNGWYLIGNLNSWGFTKQGELDLDDNYKFVLIEDDDADYNADYDQYRLTITVTEKDLKDEHAKFYISNGKIRYMNLTSYIEIDQAGTYEFTFSEKHIYGRGRNYYYTLMDEKADKQEIKINSVEDFIALAEKCNASAEYSQNIEVYLTTDLDFANTNFVSINLFNGVLHGGYHTLKNITIDNERSVYNVFDTLTTKAVVERLNIENLKIAEKDHDYIGFVGKNYGLINEVKVTGTIKGKQFVGAVAAYNGRTAESTGSTLNVYIDGKVQNCESSVAVEGFVNVGGICGFSDGKISNCKNNGTINGKSYQVNTTPVNLGGIVGCSSGRIVACENNGTIKAENSNINVGGIAGLCTGDIYYVINRGNVFGTKYVGGVAGYYGNVSKNDNDLKDYFGGISFDDFVDYFTEDEGNYEQVDGRTHIIVYSVNHGEVKAKAYAGGIVGFTELEFAINSAISDGNIMVTAGSYAGGIVGLGVNVTVTGSLSAGSISAKGTDDGKYVGGILGSGKNVKFSMSSATLIGSDYIGGIAGEITGEAKGNYTNVLIIPNKNANHIGDIAGVANNYNEALANFNGQIEYNYYVGTIGGIGQSEYGATANYAAAKIDSDKLANAGVVSPYLAKGFLSEEWIGGKDEATYPVLNYLENVRTTTEYGDDEEFAKIFSRYTELETIAEKYARITYMVAFLEWNKDNGDLYDDDKVLQKENFDLIDSVRIFKGDMLDKIPACKYAQNQDGKNIYEGNKARYFVEFNVPSTITKNINIYASYTEIATTLTDNDKILVEGLFDTETKVTLQQGPLGYYLIFTLNDQEIVVEEYTVKFLVDDVTNDYKVILSANNTEIPSEVSGKYLKFKLHGNQTFTVEKVEKPILQNWAWLTIGVASGLVCATLIAGLIARIVVVKRKKTC